MGMTEIGREAAASSDADSTGSDSGSVTADDYERVDVGDMKFTKLHPGPTAISGTAVGLRFLPPAPDDVETQYDDNGRGTAALILEDAYIPGEDFEDVSIFESTGSAGDDYKVVNTSDDGVDVYDVGISVDGMFESEERDDFGDDTVILKLSTSAGVSAVRSLDVRGLQNADVVRDETGTPVISDETGYPETNDALIEKYPDNDEDTYVEPRYSRDPQLRPDVEGEEVTIMVQRLAKIDPDYNGNAFWGTVLADLPEERQQELASGYAGDGYMSGDTPEDFIHEVEGDELLSLAPTMEFEPDEELLYATQWLEWSYPSEERVEELQAAQE